MQLNAMLCNYAEASADGKLYVTGAGITQTIAPPSGPFVIRLGLGLIVGVPYQATNHSHKLEINLIDEDGHRVQTPQGDGTLGDFNVTGDFNVGRPPGLPVGSTKNVPLAVNLTVEVPHPGTYRFEISIDGTPLEELAFLVSAAPLVFPGSGPTSIP